ncbi:protein of unknown function [Algoriphagus faecimaris]|uniref:DUF4136 domain-containing protein n=1 Tax=Algoriphagus faecimaris TaxID=686796 RepID=A0A1G6WS00_9BACT|nr:DUF4136 domain-containing protein [Algoriphagus faecimaris]SDD68554.1 protein of unknown function [Algoriphagus faecimaris]
MKFFNINKIFSTTIIALLSTSLVLGQKTYTEKKENVNLNKYDTYDWVFNKDNIPDDKVLINGDMVLLYNNSTTNKHVKDAINVQMKAKGFSHDEKDPDMLVNFHILEYPTELRTYRLTNGQDYLGFGPRSMTTKMVPVDAGTVIVNFTDAESGAHVWQGFASGAFDAEELKDISKLEAKVISIFNDWNFEPFAEE